MKGEREDGFVLIEAASLKRLLCIKKLARWLAIEKEKLETKIKEDALRYDNLKANLNLVLRDNINLRRNNKAQIEKDIIDEYNKKIKLLEQRIRDLKRTNDNLMSSLAKANIGKL